MTPAASWSLWIGVVVGCAVAAWCGHQARELRKQNRAERSARRLAYIDGEVSIVPFDGGWCVVIVDGNGVRNAGTFATRELAELWCEGWHEGMRYVARALELAVRSETR